MSCTHTHTRVQYRSNVSYQSRFSAIPFLSHQHLGLFVHVWWAYGECTCVVCMHVAIGTLVQYVQDLTYALHTAGTPET